MSDSEFPTYDPNSGPPADIQILDEVDDAPSLEGRRMTTVQITLPPGSPGSPPHKHSGPVFGYLVRGEMCFEVEGEPERILRQGESFWEPGGDLIHYRDANNLDDGETVFVVHLLLEPGAPLLTPVDAEELAARQSRRAPRR